MLALLISRKIKEHFFFSRQQSIILNESCSQDFNYSYFSYCWLLGILFCFVFFFVGRYFYEIFLIDRKDIIFCTNVCARAYNYALVVILAVDVLSLQGREMEDGF